MKETIYVISVLFLMILLSACGSDSNEHGNVGEDGSGDANSVTSERNEEDAYKVVIDPGHGGKDKGSTGVDGNYEKDFTLTLGKKVRERLEAETDIKVLMTRDDDSFISQDSRDRPKLANEQDADIFISLHQDSFEDPAVTGTESFYYDDESELLAEIIQENVTEATGFRDRGFGKKDLFVCRDTDMPAVLIEVGYLTNPRDQKKMQTDSFQDKIADSIVDGIEAYRGDEDVLVLE